MAQVLNLGKIYTKEQAEEAISKQGDFEDIPAGGYECKIVDAILNADKMYIELDLDVDTGNYAGYFQNLEDRAGFWGLRYYASYKESVLGKFLQTCTCINNSNPNFNFDPMGKKGGDVESLIGKRIGVVIGKEEYMSKKGKVQLKSVADKVTEISKIQKGNFKVPDVKKLDGSTSSSTNTSQTDDGFMNFDSKPGTSEIPF
jgi:hypothetical protein